MPPNTTRLVVATGNPHKVDEIRAVLDPLGLETTSLSDAGGPFPEPEENGTTFLENATIKAVAYAKATGLHCLADDSGLEIDALNGAPGVISSHYDADGGPDNRPRAERDLANTARVLRELEGVEAEKRTARFVCQLVVSSPDGEITHSTTGTFEGRIGVPPRVPSGDHGFGYDPIFLVAPDFSATSAELPPDEKAARSHRGRALLNLVDLLRSSPIG
ncbi:MAG: RdgB/HAM1 family non-canonical purine NTP pyrophosphatase [Planctomycetota bacterium]